MTYSPFRHIGSIFWKNRPIHLTFFLTRRCNARCPFCFYSFNREPFPAGEDKNYAKPSQEMRPSPDSQKNSKELTLNEIIRVSSSLKRLLWLAFSGGEIFLRDDIVEITEIFYKNNKPSIILFPTNALLTDIIRDNIEAVLKKCPGSTIVVKLSLEGPEQVHDSIRGKGSFQKTMRTYEALGVLLEKHPHFELGVNTVFMSKNQDTMEELITFVSRMDNIKTHTVSLIRGKVPDENMKRVDMNRYRETINKLESNIKNRTSSMYRFRGARLKAAQDILQRGLIHETAHQKKQLLPCYAGRLNLVLSEQGDLFPCESFTMRMGNVRDFGYNIQDVLQTGKAQKIIQSIRNKDCYCTHECYLMTNILFNPTMYPSLLKEYIQL
jgi:radical SAM protein with 4Fe4S-binding SPASM domain